ncbi:transcriptional regulator with XRE-family HTH domain [Krasilnikovia cinnamomea]|uniref:Transcriptional regulator with XRE-family HTH domain n=1 Tax=Krasilnikovia cinnamomea TaxID=349313 RepID=A0A4Q7ZD45_9ACTN|nr:helix-turn-helix transcriptional regulator [Krasilnikovia cinnamomea]RZU48580.1 transcriptional regulator with XRE-family HTH domain [Krasilnikovia cinnamomea]
MDQPTIGDTIARLRRARPMTQEGLAEAAGVSVETIRKLEQNKNTSARMSTLHRIARALGVPTSRLVGGAARAVADGSPDIDQLALIDLRRALTPARGLRGTIPTGPEHEAPVLDDIRHSIGTLDRAYHADDYATTLTGLPLLIDEARLGVAEAADDQRPSAYELLAQTYQLAGTVLIQLRAFDLAHRALTDALDAADTSGNDIIGASAVTTMCWLLLRQARFEETEQLAVTTADLVEPSFSRSVPAQLAVWGWLLLRAAAAAVRDNRDDDAEDMLNGAAAAAQRLGDRVPDALLSPGPATIGLFCATTVGWKRIESELIAGRPDRALALSRTIPDSTRPTSNNRNRHRLDVAAAHAQLGAYDEARTVLLALKDDAPRWLRHQRYARDVVAMIVAGKRRAMSRDVAALAALVGLDP